MASWKDKVVTRASLSENPTTPPLKEEEVPATNFFPVPLSVLSLVERLSDPSTDGDYLECGNWLVSRMWEDRERGEFEIVISFIVARKS